MLLKIKDTTLVLRIYRAHLKPNKTKKIKPSHYIWWKTTIPHTPTDTNTHPHPPLFKLRMRARRVCQARTIIRSSVVLGKKSADCTEVWTNNRSIVLVARCRERNRILDNLNSTFINTIRRHGRRKTDNKSHRSQTIPNVAWGMAWHFASEENKQNRLLISFLGNKWVAWKNT